MIPQAHPPPAARNARQTRSPGQRDVTNSGEMLSMTTSFWRPAAPATRRTSRRATPSSSAISRSSAWFAAPSTGGAATRTRRTPSTTPSI